MNVFLYLVFLCTSFSLMKAFSVLNARLDDYVVRTVSTIGPCSCKLECYSSTNCSSINYDWNQLLCELNSYDAALDSLNTSQFYHYSSIEDIRQELPDPCLGVKCGPRQKCVKTYSGIQCIITECGEPDIVSNANMSLLSTLRGVGTTIDYECYDTTTPIGDLNSTCQTDGSWSDVMGYCEVCGNLPNIPNGYIIQGTGDHLSERYIICNTGYNLTALNNTITCQADKQWSPVNTQCVYHCPTSFYHDEGNRFCALVFNQLKSWHQADEICKTYSQRLVNVNTAAQVLLLKDFVRGTFENTADVYIGGRLRDGVYKWVATNVEIDATVWDENHPRGKSCTEFHDTQHVRDSDCTRSYPFVCGGFY